MEYGDIGMVKRRVWFTGGSQFLSSLSVAPPMPTTFTKFRFMLAALLLAVVLLVVALAARLFLTGLAFEAVLRQAGATEIRFQVTQASLWRVVLTDVGFLLRLQPFAAERVTLDRVHWWTPSLGTLRIEAAKVPVKIEDRGRGPTSSPDAEQKPAGAVMLPFEKISLDGEVIIQADGQAEQALTVKIEARPDGKGFWTGRTEVVGPGVGLKGEGSYDPGSGDLVFQITELSLDVKPWLGFVRQVVPLPENDWIVEGQLSGTAAGRLAGEMFAATGTLRLREGRAESTAQAITAEGIEADLEFMDFVRVATKPGTLRIRELRTGKLTLNDLSADFALEGVDRILVSHATLRALGGRVTAEPFVLEPSQAELDAVLLAEGISVEEVMALTQDLPAKATGRVNGRVPVRIAADGLRLGTGWLALTPGVNAEIEFSAKGLLTGGAAPGTPSHAVLQKIESGLLKLRISELRLEIRPIDAPAGRSAQLHLKGEPVDQEVKAPVILNLNVNGPLEKLINMGMDSRLSVGTKP